MKRMRTASRRFPPNLQNIPIHTELGLEIRRAFLGEEERQRASGDTRQIELRLSMLLAEEKKP